MTRPRPAGAPDHTHTPVHGVPARRWRGESEARGGGAALVALLSLALATPWGFGGAPPELARLICGVALAGALVSLAYAGFGRSVWLPDVPVWPVVGLLLVAALQLAPLPGAAHATLAPGSHAVWRPGALAALGVLGDVPAPISVHPAATLRWSTWVLATASLSWLGALGWHQAGHRARWSAVVIAGVALVAIYGVFARHLTGDLIYGRFAVPTIAPFGPFVSKNHFAGYVALGVPLALGLAAGLAARSRESGWRGDWTRGPGVIGIVAALLGALVLGFAGFVSLSRGGVLNIVLGTSFFGVAWWWRSRSIARSARGAPLAAGVLALLVVTLLAVVLPEEARGRIGSVATPDGSGDFRLRTWSACLDAARASPVVGQGLGAFSDAFPRWKRGDGGLLVEHAENDYLEMLVEGGGLGLLLTLVAVGLGFGRTFGSLVSCPRGLRAGIGLGALAGLVGLAGHSALDFNLRIPSNALLAAGLAAIAVGSSDLPLRRIPVAGAIAWGIALAAALFLVARPVAEPWPAARSEALRAGTGAAPPSALRIELVEQELRETVQRRPALAEAWLLLAWTRAVRGGGEARDLANWAVQLDPERESLRREAVELGATP